MDLCKNMELKIRKLIIDYLLQVHCCWLSYCATGSMLIWYNVAFFLSSCLPGTTDKGVLNPTHSIYFIASFRLSFTWNIICSCKYNGFRAVQYEEWVRRWYKCYSKNTVFFMLHWRWVKIGAYLCFCKEFLLAIYGSRSC